MSGEPPLNVDNIANLSEQDLQRKMVEMCQKTLDDMRTNQQAQQASLRERQRQLFQRKNGAAGLTAEQAAKWREIESVVFANPEFIESIGLMLAGLVRSKQDVSSIVQEFPDLRFAMTDFLRAKAAERRAQTNVTP